MIHRYVYHNDRLLPVEQVRLSPGQAALLNGWGLFTTLRVFEGVPFAYERHWKRLLKDARRTHLPCPFEEEAVRAALGEVLSANQVKHGTARIYLLYNRVGWWRSDEPLPEVDLILYSADLPAYHEPVRLGLRENARHAASPLAGVKTTAWLNNVWNLYEAQQAGWDEAVLLNERGEVAECTAANIFGVRQGRVVTPPLDSGCLEGVTRGVLFDLARQAGIPIEERTLFPDDLYAADEVFISSTNRSVLAVGEVQGHRIAQAPGAVTRKLDAAITAYIAAYAAARSAAPARDR